MYRMQHLQALPQASLQATYELFITTIEPLEKYIEIVYKKEFPDGKQRKQILNNETTTRKDIISNPGKIEEVLFRLRQTLEESPSLRDKLKIKETENNRYYIRSKDQIKKEKFQERIEIYPKDWCRIS